MAEAKGPPVVRGGIEDREAVHRREELTARTDKTNDGGRGPKSALEGGKGSPEEAEKKKAIEYSVQLHTDVEGHGLKKGLNVRYFTAETGDDAVKQALDAHGYDGVSIRGVTPSSDPDANSLGGERDAAAMIANADNDSHIVNTLGTEANAEVTKKLAKADIKDLGA
jgi:hypothetical protein